MREFLQVDEHLFIMPQSVVAVKRSPLQEATCTIFLKGMSSQDGFVVKMDAEDAVKEIEESLAAEEE